MQMSFVRHQTKFLRDILGDRDEFRNISVAYDEPKNKDIQCTRQPRKGAALQAVQA